MDPQTMRSLAELRLREMALDDWFLDRFRFRIVGIEVTQGIQYYSASSHLTDPADRGADNSVHLVAGKPAWVRVYVRAGWRLPDIPGVTGTLQVSQRVLGVFYPPGVVLTAQPPGTVTAHSAPAYANVPLSVAYAGALWAVTVPGGCAVRTTPGG